MTGRATPPRRELVILLVYLDAGSHKAAAHRLGISESTGHQRVPQLTKRVGASNAAQAIWRLGDAALDEHRRRSRVGPDATDLMAASMPFPRPADSTEIRMAVNALPTVFEIGKEREFGRGERASPFVTHLSRPPFLLVNRTPKESLPPTTARSA